MLDMTWQRTLQFAAAVTIMTFTLTGLAVGLGVLYPNFKEENPSKIVSGFGGTFCLVLSFLYILGSVILLALAAPWTPTSGGPVRPQVWCFGAFAGLSLALGWIPYRLGLRRLRSFEG
jgi:ABC-2 type transport system permease protein